MQETESLTILEVFASIICEEGGACFLKLEPVKGQPALVVFCTSETIATLPIDQLSAQNVKFATAIKAEFFH